MLEYFQLFGATAGTAAVSVVCALYNRRTGDKKNATAVYNLLIGIAVFIGWMVLFVTDFSFDTGVFPYVVLFASCYLTCTVGLINALKTGSVLITSLLCQLSLIAVSIWGFFFWDEPFTPLVAVGLVLVCIAIFLCLYTGKTERDEKEVKFSWKWLAFVCMAFFGNAGCTISQREQQMAFGYQHGNMLMAFATLFATLGFTVMWLKTDKKDTVAILKSNGYLPVISGIVNVFSNLLVIILASSTLSASLVFPTIAIGALALTTLFSVFAFKERLYFWQWLGIVFGAVAILLLSV